MGLASIPPASSAPFPGASTVAAQGITSPGKGYWSTTLATGNYIVCGIVTDGNVGGWYASNGNNFSATGGYGVYSYANAIGSPNIPSGSPMYIKVTSNDTIWFISQVGIDTTWQYNLTNAGIARQCEWGYNKWAANNSPGDKWTFLGRNSSQNAIQVGTSVLTYVAGPKVWSAAMGSSFASTTIQSTSTEMSVWAYCNNAYFYVTQSNATFYRSTNLSTWTSISPTGLGTSVTDFCFGSFNNYYVLVTNSGVTTSSIASSTDGITWTTRTGALSAEMYSVTAGTNVYVAVGQGIQSSTDSITWTSRTNPNTGVSYGRVIWNSTVGAFIAWGEGNATPASTGQVAYSTNGTTWTAVNAQQNINAMSANTATTQMLSPMLDLWNQKYGLQIADGYYWLLGGSVGMVSTNGTKWTTFVWGRNYNDGLTQAVLWSSTNSSWIMYGIYGNGYAMAVTPNQGQFVIYNSTVS